MEWWNGMDGSDQNLVKFVLVGTAIVAVLVGWLIIRRIKQGRLRVAFAQTYGLELPKNCCVRMDKPSINSLVLAYPYVDGTRTNYVGSSNGWSSGGHGASYGTPYGPGTSYGSSYGLGSSTPLYSSESPQYFYNSGRSCSGFSSGTATTTETVCRPYSELAIDSYVVGFADPFSAYKAALFLRGTGHKIMPCMEERSKEGRANAKDVDAGNRKNSGVAGSSVILTADDIMRNVEPRFRSGLSGCYRELMDYEASRGLL